MRELRYFVLYMANQALAVVATIVALRLGKDAFSLAWTAGAVLALGWGATLWGLGAPALSSRLWTLDFRRGTVASLRTLLLLSAMLVGITLVPAAIAHVAGWANMEARWLPVFVFAGLFRAFAQGMSTFAVRNALHREALWFQWVGRTVELVTIVAGCLNQSIAIFALAWLAYPLAQISLSVMLRTRSMDPVPRRRAHAPGGWAAATSNAASQIADLVVPTIWMSLAGPVGFVAYRAVAGAISNSALVPRYWYTIVNADRIEGISRWIMHGLVVAIALIIFAVFIVGVDVVEMRYLGWGAIAVSVNAMALVRFSRIRQNCLYQGDVVSPAVAVLIGRVAESILLLILVAAFDPQYVILAYLGFSLSVPAIILLQRKQQCSENCSNASASGT